MILWHIKMSLKWMLKENCQCIPPMLVTAVANNTIRCGIQRSTHYTTSWTWTTTVNTWITSCVTIRVCSSYSFRNLLNLLLVTRLILICLILKTTTNIQILSSNIFFLVYFEFKIEKCVCTKKKKLLRQKRQQIWHFF